jgi:hypothetical protein
MYANTFFVFSDGNTFNSCSIGHIRSDQQNFLDALNHWEEVLEVISYIPPSVMTAVNGIIYLQMTAACFKLKNTSEALNVIEKGVKCMEFYYPSTH